MREADFGYTDPHGSEVLRLALRDYLGRVRGVVADAGRVVVTSGWCQGRTLLCHALVSLGAKRVGVEDPCHDEVRVSCASAGLEMVPVPVDGEGLRVDALERAAVDAVLVTPAHQYPTGAVLSGARRGALLDWLRRREVDRDRGRLRRRVPVRPRAGGGAAGDGSRAHRLRGHGEQDARAGDAAGLAGAAAAAAGGGAAAAAAGGLRRLADRAARLRRLSVARGAGPASAGGCVPGTGRGGTRWWRR